MIIDAVIIIVVVSLIAVVANFCNIGYTTPIYDSISIRESMDLCDLPIITLVNNGNKYNFLVDSGSNENHVCSKALATMIGEDTGNILNVQGFNGSAEGYTSKMADLTYKDRVFTTELYEAKDLDISFEAVKSNTGVTLHGILGNNFLREYGYVLDFEELIIYPKK